MSHFTDSMATDMLAARDQLIAEQRDEILILKQALKEAGDFALKRLPHDARESGATSEYYQAQFIQYAVGALKGEKDEIVPAQLDTD